MQITEYSDVINRDIEMKYHHNQKCRWVANFRNSETKESKSSGMLLGEYGEGTSPNRAINDYIKKIKGKVLVFDAMSKEKRIEYVVPDSLETFNA